MELIPNSILKPSTLKQLETLIKDVYTWEPSESVVFSGTLLFDCIWLQKMLMVLSFTGINAESRHWYVNFTTQVVYGRCLFWLYRERL